MHKIFSVAHTTGTMENTTKKTALIVGASSGIGYHTAKELIAHGYQIINCSRRKCNLKNVINYTFDASDGESIKAAFADILKNYTVDVFVYSAGYSMAAPFEKTKEKDYRYLFEVNFFGLTSSLMHLVPHFRNNGGGRIVAVSSMGALFPVVFDPFYSASKTAVNMLVKELSVELNPYNIYLTSVMPGGTATKFTLKRKVYNAKTAAPYEVELEKATAALAKLEQNGMDPEDVARDIIKVIGMKKPPVTSPTGAMNKAMCLAGKIMPQGMTAGINKRQYDLD